MDSRSVGQPASGRSQRLSVVFLLNLMLVVGLVAVGLAAHSFAVLAEGGDFLLDAVAVGLGVLALRASRRREQAAGRRLVDLATLANLGWLLALELLVAGGSIERLATSTPKVHGLPVLVMSGVAAAVMIAAAIVLKEGARDDGEEPAGERRDLLAAAVLLDTVADAAAAGAVAATGAVILVADGWYFLDPVVALGVSVVVAYQAAALLRRQLATMATARG